MGIEAYVTREFEGYGMDKAIHLQGFGFERSLPIVIEA
jgi:PII-like signaling protein